MTQPLAQTAHAPRPTGRRLGVLVRAMDGGGAQRDAILLANALAARGWAVSVLTLHPDGPLRPLIAPAVALTCLPARSLKAAILAFRAAFGELGPEALVLSSEAAQNVVAFLACASLPRTRRPRLLLREVTSPSIARATDPYVQNRLAYRVIGIAYARCDRPVVLTKGARDDLVANFRVPAANIAVMGANAVLDPATEQRLRAADLSIGREPGLVVAMGRLSPEKDQTTMVEAFAQLPEGLPARLVLAGEGPLRGAIEATIARLGLSERITLAGFQPDPFALLLKAQVFVSSSRFEGLGNALIEALVCGTPVVSTDCPFGPREILRGGRFGRLVPPGDARALGLAMAASLRETPDRQALQARALDYTADAAAAEFERIANELDAPQIRPLSD